MQMNHQSGHQVSNHGHFESLLEDDYKSVYWPDFDQLPGESSMAFRLRFAFAEAGYVRTQVEEVAAPPVIIVRAKCAKEMRTADAQSLSLHIQKLLGGVGLHVKKTELTLDRVGNGILAAFPSGEPGPNFKEILDEPQEDF